MPQVQPDPSRMMTYAVGPPSQGEDLRSINLTAELVSVPVGEERVNGEEGRGAIGGAIGKSKKYHGKACFELGCSLYSCDKYIEHFCVKR